MNINTLTVGQLNRAIVIKEKIESLEKELTELIGDSAPAEAKPIKRRQMSAAGKARIVAAQKARWAKSKAGNA